jgi:hypothetical protein
MRVLEHRVRQCLAPALLAVCCLVPSITRPQSAPDSAGAALLLEARHPATLVRFYESELRLPVLARDAATGRVVLNAGGTELVIVPRRPMDEPQNVTARLLLPCAALDSARVRLEGLRIPYREMQREDGTTWALFFQDPEGNSLGYCTPVRSPSSWPVGLQGSGGPELRGESGVVQLMVYGGVYGAWLSAAIPIGLGVDDAASVGACMLITSPVAVFVAHEYGQHTHVSRGQAGTISIVGNWATWQGLGWALAGDADGQDAVLAGALAGTGAIFATALLVRGREISPGQATVLHSATYWSAWYGIVGAGIAGADDKGFIYSTLAASTAGLLAGAAWGTGHDISASRARLISLGGMLGTLMGWGVVLLSDPEDDSVLWAIPGATGLCGLGFGWWHTRHREPAQFSQTSWQLDPPAFTAPEHGERFRCRLLHARF